MMKFVIKVAAIAIMVGGFMALVGDYACCDAKPDEQAMVMLTWFVVCVPVIYATWRI